MEGIDPTDPFFNNDALMDYLLETGIDGDGKGIISFEDVCVTPVVCNPDQAEVDCQPSWFRPEPCCDVLGTEKLGNTSIYTTELQIATLYVETDENVWLSSGKLCINLLNEGGVNEG